MYEYIDTAVQLRAVAKAARKVERVAFDLEADSLHHYREKACLLQLGLDGEIFLVDPLAGLDLTPLLEALAAKPLILHGGDYDLRMLRAAFDFRPRGEVFDTMLAAQLLGLPQIGLAALVEQYFDVKLSKSSQKSDWSRRPLSRKLLDYAASDVLHLPDLARRLGAELERLGRAEWHAEACVNLVKNAQNHQPRDPDLAWRIKGSHKLQGRELALLLALWQWRDSEASRIDRPAFFITLDKTLLELATWAHAYPDARLEKGPELHRSCTGRRRAALERALEQALELPEAEWPSARRPPSRRARTPDVNDKKLFSALRAARDGQAKELELDPPLLANTAALANISNARPTTRRELRKAGALMRWQAELLAPLLLPLLKK